MMRGRSYTQNTLGPCALCWREVRRDEPCTWHAPRRTWQHTHCAGHEHARLERKAA